MKKSILVISIVSITIIISSSNLLAWDIRWGCDCEVFASQKAKPTNFKFTENFQKQLDLCRSGRKHIDVLYNDFNCGRNTRTRECKKLKIAYEHMKKQTDCR